VVASSGAWAWGAAPMSNAMGAGAGREQGCGWGRSRAGGPSVAQGPVQLGGLGRGELRVGDVPRARPCHLRRAGVASLLPASGGPPGRVTVSEGMAPWAQGGRHGRLLRCGAETAVVGGEGAQGRLPAGDVGLGERQVFRFENWRRRARSEHQWSLPGRPGGVLPGKLPGGFV